MKRIVTVVPSGASSASRCAAVPRATQHGAVGRDRACRRSIVDVPTRADEVDVRPCRREGHAATTSSVPLAAGVVGPHAGVKSAMPFVAGRLVEVARRRWPVPRQSPSRRTRSSWSVPSAEMPTLDRRRDRRMLEHAAADQHAARVSVVPGEEVAVDAGDGRASAPSRLCIVGDVLAADDRLVREHGLQRSRARPASARSSR